MLLLQEWMQAASFLTTVSGACISKHHPHINSRTQLPFWIKMIDNQYLMMFNVWWFRISHSISRFEASQSGKNNCRSSNTAPSEFAFRSLGGASNVPGKGTVVPLNILFRHWLPRFPVHSKLLGLGVLSATSWYCICFTFVPNFSLKCACNRTSHGPWLRALFFVRSDEVHPLV